MSARGLEKPQAARRAPAAKLAILFWFYTDFEVCEDRLKLLRRLNRGTAIYGLFGGEPDVAPEAERRLRPWLDDLYAFAEARDGAWKWRHGDRMIAAWFRDRGASLAWDTVVVAQWDMLILEPVDRLFADLAPGEALFSGLRPAHEVAGWWGWLSDADVEKRADRDAFVALLKERYGYVGELWCCLFIVACLPRRFLELYAAAGPPDSGFLEYKAPTLARVFGVPMRSDEQFRPWWASDPSTRDAPASARLLNAVGEAASLATVLDAVIAPGGARVIHPYRARFPAILAWRPAARLARAWLRLRDRGGRR